MFQNMDIDIDLFDSYFIGPLEDRKDDSDTVAALGDDWTNQQRRQRLTSKKIKSTQSSSISTPRSRSVNNMAPSSSSPSCDVNYGPIVTDCDMSFITSTPTSCKYLNMDLVEDNFSLMARNNWSQDTATVDVSSSSSTLSAPSPTPISSSVDFVDLNFNSTMSTSTMENTNS